MKRAMLEVVVSGAVVEPPDVERYIRCTLLAAMNDYQVCVLPCSSLLSMGTCTASSNASIRCTLLAAFLEPPNWWCVTPNSLAAGWSTLPAGSEHAVDTALLWCTLNGMPVPCLRRK